MRDLKPNRLGGLKATNLYDPTHKAVFQCLVSMWTANAAFSEQQLFEQFCAALIRDRLLEKSELTRFSELQSAVALSAITAMHFTELDLGDGWGATLLATRDGHPNGKATLGVSATGVLPTLRKGKVRVAGFMFVTSLDTDTYCDQSLLSAASNLPTWDCPIELSPDKKLKRLGPIPTSA